MKSHVGRSEAQQRGLFSEATPYFEWSCSKCKEWEEEPRMRAWHVPTGRQQALAASREAARSGQAQRQGRTAQPGSRVKVKQDEDRVAPGVASSSP